jgi:tRNA pseudouridine55 synthase
VGDAKKLAQYLTLDEKSYVAEVRFGRATSTLDAEGETIAELEVPEGVLDRASVLEALRAERERTLQVPPAVSAIKVQGVRAHRLARRGDAPELPPRRVSVRALALVELGAERLTLEVTSSKGYYVRSLARDLGARLGLPAHLASLRRTRSGDHGLDHAVPLEGVASAEPIAPVDVARRCLPAVELTELGARRARLGQFLTPEHFVGKEPEREGASAWVLGERELVAVGAHTEDGYRVLRGFGP